MQAPIVQATTCTGDELRPAITPAVPGNANKGKPLATAAEVARALPHAQQGAHAQLFHFIFIEHCQLRAGALEGLLAAFDKAAR